MSCYCADCGRHTHTLNVFVICNCVYFCVLHRHWTVEIWTLVWLCGSRYRRLTMNVLAEMTVEEKCDGGREKTGLGYLALMELNALETICLYDESHMYWRMFSSRVCIGKQVRVELLAGIRLESTDSAGTRVSLTLDSTALCWSLAQIGAARGTSDVFSIELSNFTGLNFGFDLRLFAIFPLSP